MIKVTNAIMYEIRDDNGSHPVFITINADGESCHFTGSGDYGDYAHYWGAMGMEYREFLCKLNYGYFFEKITNYKITQGLAVDVKASKKSIKKNLLFSYRRLLREHEEHKHEAIKEETQKIFEAIDDMGHCLPSEFYNNFYYQTKDLINFYYYDFEDGMSYMCEFQRDGQCEGFWRQFKKLCEHWQKELEEEKKAA